MKVSELIELLKELDGDQVVVLAGNEEGNDYHELNYVAFDAMFDDGEIGLRELEEESIKAGFCAEDVMTRGEKAIVLYP